MLAILGVAAACAGELRWCRRATSGHGRCDWVSGAMWPPAESSVRPWRGLSGLFQCPSVQTMITLQNSAEPVHVPGDSYERLQRYSALVLTCTHPILTAGTDGARLAACMRRRGTERTPQCPNYG